MSDDAAPTAAVRPAPPRALPPRISKALGLVRTLIAYGKDLADTLRQHASDPHVLPCFAFITSIFDTTDLALILARIARGLLRAAALQARLNRLAARGRDLTPTPLRLSSPCKPRNAKPAVLPDPPAEAPCLAYLPTLDEILAKDRRRPIGAVLVNICLDLGIAPGQMDYATQDDLRRNIIEYGGNLVALVLSSERKRRSAARTSPSVSSSSVPIPITGSTEFPAWPVPFPRSPVPTCTGPP